MKRPSPAVLGAIGLGAAWLLYFSKPGRSLTTLGQDLGGLVLGVTLTTEQRAMVDIIADQFARNGMAWLTVAAVANAWAESRLDPLASGDGGKSIGLFQLHEAGGGLGMSVEARQDPVANCQRIIGEAKGQPALLQLRGRATNAELASAFARYVERCWECGGGGGDAQLGVRAGLVTTLYGAQVAATVPV